VCSRCASKSIPCEYKSAPSRTDAEFAPGETDYDMFGTLTQDPITRDFPIATQTMFPELVTAYDTMPFLPDGKSNGTTISNNMEVINTGAFDFDDKLDFYDNGLLANPLPDVGVMDRDRIKYVVRQLKSYPEMLFRQGKAPFIHSRSYENTMPQAIQDACSACALYAGKTEQNEAMVWDIITAKANLLMEPRRSWSMSEHLACLQALIIFQILCLFDGHIRQRADGEQHEAVLTQWTDLLVQRTGTSESVVSTTWESWVFEEAIRRTIIVSLMVKAMFSIQKQGFCTLVGAVTELSFTARKSLWEAPTSQHWQRACKERSKLFISHMDFEEVLSTANLSEVDELCLLMMVTYKGIDGVNEWISRTGHASLIE
jgi:hypothetical protein